MTVTYYEAESWAHAFDDVIRDLLSQSDVPDEIMDRLVKLRCEAVALMLMGRARITVPAKP